MSPSIGRSNRPIVIKSSASCHPPSTNLQTPLILPHTSPDQGSSNDLTGARSFVTKTWTIPNRPKPGRKPKQQPTRLLSKQSPQRPDQPSILVADSGTHSIQNSPPSVVEVEAETIIKTKGQKTSVSPDALQQAYINSLKAKIERLQTQQFEQAKYHKSNASQSNFKLNTIQSENEVLQSQVKVLRGEVLRLRERISQLVKKSTTNIPLTYVGIEQDSNNKESKVRKQVSPSEVENVSSLEQFAKCTKKPRHQPDHSEANDSKSDALPASKCQNSPSKLLSEVYLVPESSTLTLEPNNTTTKSIPDFTSSDIYCGLCTSELDCVCRQVGLKPPLARMDPSQRDHSNNLLAVPIRRRSQASTNNIWTLVAEDDSCGPRETSPSGSNRQCNGNPKDCLACRDDPFGQAFCTALNQANVTQAPDSLNKTVAVPTPCASSTTKRLPQSDPVVDVYTSIPCCGDPELCGSQNCFKNTYSPTGTKISCSEAWRQLKVHPNIGLANLQLLADVVARKSTPYTTSIDSNKSLLDDHPQLLPHQSSSLSMHENEESIFSPHLTLSTVFENVHADLEDDYQVQNPTFQNHYPSEYSLNDNFLTDSTNPFQVQQGAILTGCTSNSLKRHVKFVEKESLDQALRMLDRAR